MKFNHLNVPTHWQNYWSRYPEGHTILEALISWVSQVDSMVDNQNKLNDNVEQFRNEIDDFVGRFDDRLQDEVTRTLADWQTSGFLDVVISEALQWQLDDYITTNEQDKLALTEQLEQNKIQVFEEKPLPEDLLVNQFAFVPEKTVESRFNLKFDDINSGNNFPFLWVASPVGDGVKETELLHNVERGNYIKVAQDGGTNGASNYSRLNTGQVIPFYKSKVLTKSDLINFSVDVQPLSSLCRDGEGAYFCGITAIFRDDANAVLFEHTKYFSFSSHPSVTDSDINLPFNVWSTLKYDLYSVLEKRPIDAAKASRISLSARAYTNHSTASAGFYISELSFGGV